MIVVPLVVLDGLSSRKRLVDIGSFGDVINISLEGGISEKASNRREEEALHIDSPEIDSGLERVRSGHVGNGLLQLICVIESELRQIDRKTNRSPRGRRVEACQPELRNLN
jgi:hypothetical protein